MLKVSFTYFFILFSCSFFAENHAKITEVKYYVDTSDTFIPSSTTMSLFKNSTNKFIDKSNQAWFSIKLKGGIKKEKVVLFYYSGGADFWIRNTNNNNFQHLPHTEKIEFEQGWLYELDNLHRGLGKDDAIQNAILTHRYLPILIHPGEEIELIGRLKMHNYIQGGSNDWRFIHLSKEKEVLKSEILNFGKFVFFFGTSLILIIISLALSFRNIIPGVKFYVFMCLSNLIFISACYPFGSYSMHFFETYLIPNTFFLPISHLLYIYFIIRFLEVKNKYINYSIMATTVGILFLVFYYLIYRDLSFSYEILAWINTLLIPSLIIIFIFSMVKTNNNNKFFIALGTIISFIGGLSSGFLHSDKWFSLWLGVFDPMLFGFLIEQSLFAYAIIKYFDIKEQEKIFLEKELTKEQIRISVLTKETVQIKIDQEEKAQAVNLAITQLQNLSSITDEDKYSSEVSKTIKVLNKHSKNSTLFDSIKLLIEEVSPTFFINLEQKHPNLTPNEKRMAAFYYMKLSNNEIANLLNISINSLYVTKARLKKKLNFGSELSFEQYILSI